MAEIYLLIRRDLTTTRDQLALTSHDAFELVSGLQSTHDLLVEAVAGRYSRTDRTLDLRETVKAFIKHSKPQ